VKEITRERKRSLLAPHRRSKSFDGNSSGGNVEPCSGTQTLREISAGLENTRGKNKRVALGGAIRIKKRHLRCSARAKILKMGACSAEKRREVQIPSNDFKSGDIQNTQSQKGEKRHRRESLLMLWMSRVTLLRKGKLPELAWALVQRSHGLFLGTNSGKVNVGSNLVTYSAKTHFRAKYTAFSF